MAEITLIEAVNQAFAYEMRSDKDVVLLGEDVGVNGGVFRATDGLIDEFGSDRVVDTPLAESVIVGMGIGMAAQGLKPIVELQFMGFIYPAVDQIINHAWVPLQEIAELSEGSSYNTINRVDRQRAITVIADTAPDVSPESIMATLMPSFRRIEREHPAITIDLAGRQRQLRKAFESLPVGFAAAMVMIYVILAWLFSSYTQPIAVMLAIPFSIIGVVWGHMILGYQLTFLSLIGFVALSGIVVNDSLILIQFYNTKRADGRGVAEGLIAAGRQRLRPILLTTITTVLGLTPLMLEQSFQAKFLIPMRSIGCTTSRSTWLEGGGRNGAYW